MQMSLFLYEIEMSLYSNTNISISIGDICISSGDVVFQIDICISIQI